MSPRKGSQIFLFAFSSGLPERGKGKLEQALTEETEETLRGSRQLTLSLSNKETAWPSLLAILSFLLSRNSTMIFWQMNHVQRDIRIDMLNILCQDQQHFHSGPLAAVVVGLETFGMHNTIVARCEIQAFLSDPVCTSTRLRNTLETNLGLLAQ